MAYNHNTAWKANALGKSLTDHGDDLVRSLNSVRNTQEVGNHWLRMLQLCARHLFFLGKEPTNYLHWPQFWWFDYQTG
jgi:hypothetical protein